jgi:heat shock protein HtpX
LSGDRAVGAFTRRNRARIAGLVVLATLNYCFAVAVAAIIAGVTVALVVVLWAVVEAGWVPGSLGELEVAGVVVLAIAVAAAVVGTMTSLVRIPSLRRRLEQRVLEESDARLVEPDTLPRVRNVLDGLAIAAGVPAPRFAVIDDAAPNAFGVGTRPESTVIGVTTGLVDALSRDELEALLAFEITRVASWDVALCSWAVALTGDAVGKLEDTDAGRIVGRPWTWCARRIQRWALRDQDEARDAAAIGFSRNPAALVRALEALAADPRALARASVTTAPLWVEVPHADFDARIARLRGLARLPLAP